jgi:hypothetical protein
MSAVLSTDSRKDTLMGAPRLSRRQNSSGAGAGERALLGRREAGAEGQGTWLDLVALRDLVAVALGGHDEARRRLQLELVLRRPQ